MKPYSAARSGAFIYVRAHGPSNMKTASVLDAFLRTGLAEGATEVVIDLSDCSGMDSTFMGTLVGFSQTMREQGGRLVVVNPGEHNLRLLETLGVTTVLPVLQACDLRAIDLTLEPLEYGPAQSTDERMHMVKQAHENLIRITDDNEAKFRPFLDALEADLRRRDEAEEAEEAADAAERLAAASEPPSPETGGSPGEAVEAQGDDTDEDTDDDTDEDTDDDHDG